MKRPLILAIALATLTANAAFAAPRVESIALRGAQQLNGSEQTVDRLHKDMGRVDLRLADNGSERTVDRLHREMRRPA